MATDDVLRNGTCPPHPPTAGGGAAARVAALLAAAAWLPACATPEPRQPLPLRCTPPFSPPGAFSDEPADVPAGAAPLPDRWWTTFADPHLDQRVDAALAGSFSLAAAWERLREAEAVTRRARAEQSPSLDGVAFGELRAGSDVDESTAVGVGLQAAYEVDLWGRVRSLVDAETLRASATAADYHTAAISLSAEVALAWYELAEAHQQLDLIASQVQTNRTVLEVLEARFAVGQSDAADVLRQRQLVEATLEQAIVAGARVQVLEHRLAVLEGRAPQQAIELPLARLPDVPDPPATGLPAQLLDRRPDVLGAFLRLEASDADVAAAVRDQSPRLDLAAAATTTGEHPSDLFEDWLGVLAGQLLAPLLDGGLRRAELERTVAVRRQRLAEYGQTVLVAFREVQDALALEAHQVRRIRSLRDQLALAESTYRQLRNQYLNGASDFIDVLAALRESQALERSLLTAELDRVALRIALHRSLAGGFGTPHERQEPAGDDVANASPASATMATGSSGGSDGGGANAAPRDAAPRDPAPRGVAHEDAPSRE